jgi:hygromycin-B 4-O-kinase
VKTKLSTSGIQKLVERKIGAVSRFEQLPEGLVSQAYGFWRDGEPYVVRVGRSPDGFNKDAFAWRAFSSTALPIPEVICVDTSGDVSICISRRASGVRVSDVDGNLATLSARILDVLAALDRTDTSATIGFGAFDARGRAPCQTWGGYLLRVSAPDFCDWDLIGDRTLRRCLEAAIQAVERLAPADPPGRGLIHGDFGSANLISDGRAVTAIIDWDRAMIGDAAYDQANLF